MVLVVYMMYYIVLCYIPHDTGGIYGVLHRSMLHPPIYWCYTWWSISFYVTPPGYWWCIWCTTSFCVISPRLLVVYMMYFIVLCYIPQDTGGVYDVLHRFMLHPTWFWWFTWCSIYFYVTTPRVLVVYMMYLIVLCYIPQDTGGVYDVLHCSMLHPPWYLW